VTRGTYPFAVPASKSNSDDELHEEFVLLLNSSHRQLLSYLFSILANRHDAEDVLQRTSITLWRKFSSFERGTNFAAWASTVAFYEARNFQRMGVRSRLQFSDALLEILSVERTADMAHTDARHDALGHCLEKLDDAGRRLVEAAYLDGSDIGLLAEQLGRARQTLYNKLNIIRRSLAECVMRRMAAEGAP